MRRPALRTLMAVVGLATFAVPIAGASLASLLVAAVWSLSPSGATVR